MLDPGVDDRREPGSPGAASRAGRQTSSVKRSHGGGEDGALQRLLVAEAPDQAALAHRELAGEAADGEALEALDRGEVDGGGDRVGAAVGDVGGGAAGHA